jgi:hypothetical protein
MGHQKAREKASLTAKGKKKEKVRLQGRANLHGRAKVRAKVRSRAPGLTHHCPPIPYLQVPRQSKLTTLAQLQALLIAMRHPLNPLNVTSVTKLDITKTTVTKYLALRNNPNYQPRMQQPPHMQLIYDHLEDSVFAPKTCPYTSCT